MISIPAVLNVAPRATEAYHALQPSDLRDEITCRTKIILLIWTHVFGHATTANSEGLRGDLAWLVKEAMDWPLDNPIRRECQAVAAACEDDSCRRARVAGAGIERMLSNLKLVCRPVDGLPAGHTGLHTWAVVAEQFTRFFMLGYLDGMRKGLADLADCIRGKVIDVPVATESAREDGTVQTLGSVRLDQGLKAASELFSHDSMHETILDVMLDPVWGKRCTDNTPVKIPIGIASPDGLGGSIVDCFDDTPLSVVLNDVASFHTTLRLHVDPSLASRRLGREQLDSLDPSARESAVLSGLIEWMTLRETSIKEAIKDMDSYCWAQTER